MSVKTIRSKEELAEAVYGFRASRIILTAFELDLFSALGKASLDAIQVATVTGTDPGPASGCSTPYAFSVW